MSARLIWRYREVTCHVHIPDIAHKYPGSLVPYAQSVYLSESWAEITLIASHLTQHNKRHYNTPPCPASPRMFSLRLYAGVLHINLSLPFFGKSINASMSPKLLLL